MDNEKVVMAAAAQLKEAIQQCDCVKNYEKYKALVVGNDEMLAKIEYLKKLQLEHALNEHGNEKISLDKEKELSKLYFDVLLNEDAKQFIECESELLKMLSQVFEVVSGGVDVYIGRM